jgi:hypothetical protein
VDQTVKDEYNDIVWTNPYNEIQQYIEQLDNPFEALAKKYYPILVSLHAPSNPSPEACTQCGQQVDRFFTCTDCFHQRLMCSRCLCEAHRETPFHQVQEWNHGLGCYLPASLADLGLVVTLDHTDGSRCFSTSRKRILNVVHTNGIHQLAVCQCDCSMEELRRPAISPGQLLSNKLFPATHDRPNTVFTFQVLELFNQLNLESYINVNQFCDTMSGLGERDRAVGRKVKT